MTHAPQQPVFRVSQRRFASFRTISALILREMSTQYGNTPGGYIWVIIEPLLAIVFLSIGFSLLLRAPSLGTSFLMFYASGYIFFATYQTVSNAVARAIRFSRPLLSYPAVGWLDAVLARLILNATTSLLVGVLLMAGIIWSIDYRAVIDPVPLLLAAALVVLLGAGVGLVNCVIAGRFPLWDVVWAILSRPLFLASGILYIYEDLPTGFAQSVLWANPLVHVIGLARTGLYPTYQPTYISILFVVFVGLILVTLGLILMRRYNRELLQT